MKSHTLKLLLTLLIIPFAMVCFPQKSPKGQGFNNTIYFDETGKLTGEVPELINKRKSLTAIIKVSDKTRLKDLIEFEKKCAAAKKYIDSLTPGQKDYFKRVYGIDTVNLLKNFNARTVHLRKELKRFLNRRRFMIKESRMAFNKETNEYSIILDDLQSLPGSSISKLEFDLEGIIPLRYFIFHLYNNSKPSYKTIIDFSKIDKFKKESDPIFSDYKSMERESIENTRFQNAREGNNWLDKQIAERKVFLETVNGLNSRINDFFGQIKNNSVWIQKWLWYTGGKPLLNPFPFCDPDEIKAPDSSDINALREKILARTTLIKIMSASDVKSLRKIDSLIDDRNNLSDSLFKLCIKFKNEQKVITDNNNSIEAFSTIREKLNSLTFFITDTTSKKEPFAYMRHHDARQAYSLMNSLTHDEYLEEDRVIILNHNLKRTDKPNFTFRESAITNDQSGLADNATPYFNAISINAMVPEGGTNKKSESDSVMRILPKDGFQTLDTTKISKYYMLTKAIKDSIIVLRKNLKYLNQIPIQKNPYLQIKEKLPDSAILHSEVCNSPKKIKGATRTTYAFTGDVNDTAKPPKEIFTYRVNKLYRIFPAAGFAYTFYPDFIDVTYDKIAVPQFNQKITHPVNYIVGLKVHPFRKIDIRDTRIFWKHDDKNRFLLWSRISFTFAFGVKDPLKNLFAGVGLDVFPGLCLTAGTHFNNYTHISFKSGNQIDKSIYRTGIYIGILTDVALVAQIAKMIGFK